MLKIQEDGYDDVYDFSVPHTSNFFINDILVHNCFEIAFTPILDFKKEITGVSLCNLSEINGKLCKTKEKFLRACKSGAIFGTLQAGYSDFSYLGSITEEIVRQESLIGVSITGWMNTPELFNEEWLHEGVALIEKTNRELAEILGINPAARLTTTKPAGNCQTLTGEIKTERGILALEEIFNYCSSGKFNINEYKENTFLPVTNPLKVYDENNELKDINALYINSVCDVYEVEFEDGIKYEFTGGHRLKTVDGWKTIEELSLDDDIISFDEFIKNNPQFKKGVKIENKKD